MQDQAARATPEEIAPGVWRLIFPINTFLKSVNAYLIRDRDGYAFVDCGMDTDECWVALQEQLGALKAPLSAVHTIVATHGHPDHTGLAGRIRGEAGTKVLLHGSEEAFLAYRRHEGASEMLERWLVRFGVPDGEAAGMAGHVREADRAHPSPQPDELLNGGEELTVGDYTFEVRWTPGHTPGHVCLYEPGHQLLLCGDHILQEVAPNVALLPYSDENPMPGYLSSLEWLADMRIRLSLPGHGLPFGSPRERALGLIAHQSDRQAHVLSLLTPRPQTAYRLAEEVWRDSTPNNWSQFSARLRRNAMATLAAHLELLAARGEARRIDDGVVAYAAA
jgi:glyoxylase-like metal-dependent hydrolase (beta-lactamase superfamily II)